MNIYNDLSEIDKLKDATKNQKDIILDHYFKDPKRAKELMLELLDLEKELDDLEKEFDKLLHEIS